MSGRKKEKIRQIFVKILGRRIKGAKHGHGSSLSGKANASRGGAGATLWIQNRGELCREVSDERKFKSGC